jgi:hypothetical protein
MLHNFGNKKTLTFKFKTPFLISPKPSSAEVPSTRDEGEVEKVLLGLLKKSFLTAEYAK